MDMDLFLFSLPELVMALLEGAYDKEEAVRGAIMNALNDLGKKQPALVLSSCHSYLAKHSKVWVIAHSYRRDI